MIQFHLKSENENVENFGMEHLLGTSSEILVGENFVLSEDC